MDRRTRCKKKPVPAKPRTLPSFRLFVLEGMEGAFARIWSKKMEQNKKGLITAARAVCETFALEGEFSAGTVGAAIRTADGHIYTGICVDLGCGLGFCAEVAAMADMLKHHETRIEAMVAASKQGIMPPCGRCRETMVQIDRRNVDSRIILGEDREVSLRDLLPHHWLSI